MAFREAAKVNPVLAKWSMNITIDNWREAKSAAAAAAAYDAAAAVYAAAKKLVYHEMRIEAERVLCAL